MPFPVNVFANADDFGYSASVNKAILFCFENEYINSATLLTNTPGFEEAVQITRDNQCVKNIGIHINLAEGKPLTNLGEAFLNADGCFSLQKTGKASGFFTKAEKLALVKEISAQINKGLSQGIAITHIDSHYHLHTLPGLFNLFLHAAGQFKLKMRLAQTYREGSYLKFWYRQYINSRITARKLNYSDRFESVNHFLSRGLFYNGEQKTEVMLHPDFDPAGTLTDHFDAETMVSWLNYLKQLHKG
ncbi:carbohydrate deacetylase [Mucilaginibacter gilvus]|uniref:ChbG/HpnK family deacetylase n=1 Tax=Mucilaginibacter gilvus TaxID=2305909 RepID=A0A444MJ14_9SPHI|nr:ChbG/HpnK family deacetylase [Mucilaginibacter gilvus]RWY48121.1 ChbG/HpnK family deacetylase [Mucilaginibacter gilvus]